MIKKLRRRFIIIAMSSVAAVLLVIMGAINIINYRQIGAEADKVLNMLAENGGEFPRLHDPSVRGDIEPIAPDKLSGFDYSRKAPDGMSEETPYESRFFTVTFNADGSILSSDTGNVAAVDEEQARSLALEVYSGSRSSGYSGSYKYLRTDTGGTVMIIFLDCQRALATFRSFVLSCVGVSAAGLLSVFILVFVLSKVIMKPVAQSYEKQKSFITDASHELRTPLTVIDANTEVLEMEQGENEWTRSTRNQVARLTALTEDLIMLSRMEEDSSQRAMTDFSLSDAVEESAEPFYALAQARGKKIVCDIEKNITLHGDEPAVRKAVELLCDNAVKYSTDGAVINITLRKRGQAVLEVSNPAESVTKGSHEELFERFYRGDSSRSTQTAGYGIGLSTVRAIAARHRGKVSAISPDGKSIVFTITF